MQKAYSPVHELNLLMEFQNRMGFENYSDGFGLTAYNDSSGLKAGWSKDPGFLARLVPFAQANGSGSFYALWRLDDRADLASLPIVVFGDEGGQHVVARNLRELLQLLGFDSEVSVDWDEAYFYREEGQQHRRGHAAYVAWLDQQFGLPAADDPDSLVGAAQAELGERFASWAAGFLPG